MIETSELRIGNSVLWNRHDESLENEVVEIYTIQRASVRAYTEIEELSEMLLRYEDIEPIPLTEEWLVRFGFTYDGVLIDMLLEIEKYKFLGYDNKSKRVHCYHFKPTVQGANLCECKYVHQLQNLYFALTGGELTIKE